MPRSYDDERGDYRVVAGDHLGYRYEVLDNLGSGSFGVVVRAKDHKPNVGPQRGGVPLGPDHLRRRIVAAKIIRNKKKFHHQALIEIKILTYIREHDPQDDHNLAQMLGFFHFRGHLVLTFELLSINLYEFLKNNHFQGVSLSLVRRFGVQLFSALAFLQKHRIIHCDVKPENVLLRSPTKSALKLIDFGSSCFEDERLYTYIQSRFYRAPEILCGIPNYVGYGVLLVGDEQFWGSFLHIFFTTTLVFVYIAKMCCMVHGGSGRRVFAL